MTVTTDPTVGTGRRGGLTEIRTDAYTLLVDASTGSGFEHAPYAILEDTDGRVWSALNLLSSVHTVTVPDETWRVDGCTVEPGSDAVTLRVRSASTAWRSHELTLVCRPEAVELSVRVEGRGRLADVVLLGGQASLPDGAAGAFASSIDVASVLVPAPGEPVQLVRPSHTAGQVGLVGDAAPGRLHAVFSPPPLVFGLGRSAPTGPTEVPAGDWLGVSLRAPVTELTFTTLAYQPLDGGFVLRLAYEGHTVVHGVWTSPVLVLRPAATGWAVLADHRRDLVEHGCAPAEGPRRAAWWSEPMFCGWGAQCARAAALALEAGNARGGAEPSASVGADPAQVHADRVVTTSAAGLGRQDVYDELLARLGAHGVEPGTVVLDDRWQAEYGTALPDPEHWPDLKGWIADQHARGRRVLLWWKAWDPGGVPAAECVRDAGGRPVAVDPANPAYLRRLAGMVEHLVSPAGLDADGFKVDFTQRAPSGVGLSSHPGVWGIAALHTLLGTLHAAAHRAKPDALVVAHAVHPAFADVCDMVRLNDVAKSDVTGNPVPVVDQLRMRHGIARRTLPDHLIDTDQWPMPDRAEWLRYVEAQAGLGVPALYYVETMDRSGEPVRAEDLASVARTWARYREGRRP